jgi:hypothetical protein
LAAPRVIHELVERFERNFEAYHVASYNETQVRLEFINPMFKSLGWDIDNEQGLAEAYKDVVHEDAIKVGGATKAPDYCFRVGGTRKFFLEAKKPAVDLKEDTSPAYQLRRYAWSAKLPLSILTDFEEFAVYDCRIRPAANDKPSTARTLYMKYTDYLDRWDEIASIFSRDAVLKGSFDKYAESTYSKRGTAEVDDAFLAEIESWRDMLARNIALRNPGLTQRELNFAVQRTIDRIIFLRICEDRGVEDHGRLQALLNGANVYARLRHLYDLADQRYNSGLFYFHPEKDRPGEPDTLTPNITLDDKALREIFKNLYYPQSPYEFSVLPADILGHVYEQFLGKVIRLTKGHRAVVEEKPEVRKAGGVYYTPTYIVDYIVKNTVGKLLDGKTPGLRGNAAKLRILDPACGSGSFLLGAYQYLLDWHLEHYINDDPQKWARLKIPALFQDRRGEWRLTAAERKRILLNNIYGVDIDPQAVEVTKLSLLLKVLEGESAETLQKQLTFLHERALPDLGHNIKCGNSLIGPDFYDNQQPDMFDEEEVYRINAFAWNAEFPEVMKSGGFDAVISNPPYVRQEGLGELKGYFQQHYSVYHGVADLYAYFIEKGVSLLNKGGYFGYIVANKWMRANYGEPLRRWLRKQRIEQILDFGDQPVFKSVTTYPCIMIISKNGASRRFPVTQVKTLDFQNLSEYVREHAYPVKQTLLDDKGWSLTDEKTRALLEKITQNGVPLGEYVNGKIFYGIKTGLNKAFVIDAKTRDALIRDDPKSSELLKPFLMGRDIKRYEPLKRERYLILIPRGWTCQKARNLGNPWRWLQDNYPAIASHLEPFSSAAEKRWDKGDYWWELRACEYYNEFEKPKIIVPAIVQNASYTYDTEGFYSNDKTTIIAVDDLYLLGLLNSKTLDFVLHSIASTKAGGYFEYKPMYLEQLPICQIRLEEPAERAVHSKIVELVKTMLSNHERLKQWKTDHEKSVVQRQIEISDHQIDRLVYELYGLTEDEILIVEAAG